MAPRVPTTSKINFWPPSCGPSWGPKSSNIAPKSDPTCVHFFDRFEYRFGERFGANLAPFGPPKPSQHGAKLGLQSIKLGAWICELFSEGSWLDVYFYLHTTEHSRRHECIVIYNTKSTFLIFVVVLLGMIC